MGPLSTPANPPQVTLFEFNTSPVLKDPEDQPVAHDADKVRSAMAIVFPWPKGDSGQWQLAATIKGPPPLPEEEEKK